jgi:hypothetical protein
VQVASAGFVLKATGDSPDNVECFMCGAGLEGWEPGDDPTCVWVGDA